MAGEQMELAATLETRRYPLLGGAFLVLLAVALMLVSFAVGTESYPYIHRPVAYRFPLATLDRVYLLALAILGAHYAAFVVHYLVVGRQASPAARVPPLEFSPVKFVITWFFLIGLAGVYMAGASIATPTLFDPLLGPARETEFARIWNHTYFGFVLLTSIVGGIVYFTAADIRAGGIGSAFHWLGGFLSLRAGHRFMGLLNWILLLAVVSNVATGFFMLGNAPLLASFARLPVHPYWTENFARLAHDTGTAFIVSSFSGLIYLRLIPGNQWMLKTMFAGYQLPPSSPPQVGERTVAAAKA
jgi:hypothetical protein